MKSEASLASHHSIKGLAFAVASILNSGVSINQVLMVFPSIASEVEFNGKEASTGTNTGGHGVGKYQIVSGTGAYQGATGTGGFEGDWGDKSPLKNAGLYSVELNIKTP
jgi:hypothetical protein